VTPSQRNSFWGSGLQFQREDEEGSAGEDEEGIAGEDEAGSAGEDEEGSAGEDEQGTGWWCGTQALGRVVHSCWKDTGVGTRHKWWRTRWTGPSQSSFRILKRII
jgi:hypothetical protein